MPQFRNFFFLLSCFGVALVLYQIWYCQVKVTINLRGGDIKYLTHIVENNRYMVDLPGPQTDKGNDTATIQTSRVDFTVNEIMDRLKNSSKGDFVSSDSDKIAPQFVRTKSVPNQFLKVIVLPHSHNDPGYKKTFEEYFKTPTSHILTSAVEKLTQFKDMTFLWQETCFLEKWWARQTESVRTKFKHLVKSGRLEIASGAWVVPDEATSHYFGYLDQMIEGHSWIRQHLDVMPENSFDQDQFSVSSSVRYLMKEAGLKHVVVKRVHLGMKEFLMQRKMMDFYWRQPWDETGLHDIFIQTEPYEWLSFPDSCGPNRYLCMNLDMGGVYLPSPKTIRFHRPIKLLVKSFRSVPYFAELVVEQLRLKSDSFQENVLLLPHGGDFKYANNMEWDRQYTNTKILMDYINSVERFNISMQFGTLKDYFSELSLKGSKNYGSVKYPVMSGEFVPFATNTRYWSGYFSTRRFLKRLGRQVEELVRSTDILMALFAVNENLSELSKKHGHFQLLLKKLVNARRAVDLFQHHDAITGTSLERVVKDYQQKLITAFKAAQGVMAFIIQHTLQSPATIEYNLPQVLQNLILAKDPVEKNDHHQGNATLLVSPTMTLEDNHSLPTQTEIMRKDNGTKIVLVNSYTQERTEVIGLVSNPNILILDHYKNVIAFDYHKISATKTNIFFQVKLPPLSFSVYTLLNTNEPQKGTLMIKALPEELSQNMVCENSEVNVTFSRSNGSPLFMCYKKKQFCVRLGVEWLHYTAPSGAYTFPSGYEHKYFKVAQVVGTLSGTTLCKVSITHKLFRTEYILHKTPGTNGKRLEIRTFIDLSENEKIQFRGEFAMRINTSVYNDGTLYTDSNGMQLLKRKFREGLPMGANVFPMTSMAVMEDSSYRMTVHSSQPYGVASPVSGVLDIMIDRSVWEMEFGLKQRVTDNKPTVANVYIQFDTNHENTENTDNSELLIPALENVLLNDFIQHPVFTFQVANSLDIRTTLLEFLRTPVPCDVIIANMKCLTDDAFQLEEVTLTLYRRMSRIHGVLPSICPKHSKIVEVNPRTLFHSFDNQKYTLTEMYLTGLKAKKTLSSDEVIKLSPNNIKTFLFKD